MLAPFDGRGNLPPGIHFADWREVIERFGGTTRRQELLVGLRQALDVLRYAGCRTVFLDGSFVTAKAEPGDFDACWDLEGVDVERLDPELLDFSNGRAAQKAKYLGELFPAQLPEGLSGRRFLEFFQVDRETGGRKGIVAIELSSLEGVP